MDEPSGDIVTELAKQRLITVDRSPEQLRAASGLRWMLLAAAVRAIVWTLYVVPGAAVFAGIPVSVGPDSSWRALHLPLVVGSWVVSGLADLAFAAGLWRFGGLSRPAGARRAARASFWFLIVPTVGSWPWLGVVSLSHRVPSSDLAQKLMLAMPSVVGLLVVLSAALLMRALALANRHVGATLSRWARWGAAVGLVLLLVTDTRWVLWFGTGSDVFVRALAALTAAAMVAGIVAWISFVTLLRGTARALSIR